VDDFLWLESKQCILDTTTTASVVMAFVSRYYR